MKSAARAAVQEKKRPRDVVQERQQTGSSIRDSNLYFLSLSATNINLGGRYQNSACHFYFSATMISYQESALGQKVRNRYSKCIFSPGFHSRKYYSSFLSVLLLLCSVSPSLSTEVQITPDASHIQGQTFQIRHVYHLFGQTRYHYVRREGKEKKKKKRASGGSHHTRRTTPKWPRRASPMQKPDLPFTSPCECVDLETHRLAAHPPRRSSVGKFRTCKLANYFDRTCVDTNCPRVPRDHIMDLGSCAVSMAASISGGCTRLPVYICIFLGSPIGKLEDFTKRNTNPLGFDMREYIAISGT